MTRAALTNPFRAPTSSETSSLECTHIACGECDAVEEWPAGTRLGGWSCEHCGDEESPVFEHHSPTPLGYRDDKKCLWESYEVAGRRIPDVWIYLARPVPE